MEEKNITVEEEYSNIVPIWKFVIMSIIAFPFYHYYWIYKNWVNIKNNFIEYRDINPLLRTLGTFLIPIFGYYLIYKQFKIVRINVNKVNPNYFKVNIIVIIILFAILDNLGWKNFPYNLLVVFNFLPFAFIQKELNIIWKSLEARPKSIKLLLPIEKLLLILGFFIWIIFILYILVKIKY